MFSQENKPSSERDPNQKQLDREVREMVSAITRRLSDLHKPGSSHTEDVDGGADDNDHGVRLITLAGTNTGATLKTELDDKLRPPPAGEPEPLSTYVNSNVQAFNNSIMMGGSYATNDPGVHVDISDFYEEDQRVKKHGKKGKKKEKESSKSDKHSGDSD